MGQNDKEENYKKYFWNEIETKLRTCVPMYMKNAINFSGNANPISFKTLNKGSFDYLTEFVKSNLYKRIVTENSVEFYGIFFKDDPENFEFTPGDVNQILGIVDILKQESTFFTEKKQKVTLPRTLPSDSPKPQSSSVQSDESSKDSSPDELTNYIKNREIAEIKKKIAVWGKKKNKSFPEYIINALPHVEISINKEKKNSRDFYVAVIPCPEQSCPKNTTFSKEIDESIEKNHWSISNFTRHVKHHFPGPQRKRTKKTQRSRRVISSDDESESE